MGFCGTLHADLKKDAMSCQYTPISMDELNRKIFTIALKVIEPDEEWETVDKETYDTLPKDILNQMITKGLGNLFISEGVPSTSLRKDLNHIIPSWEFMDFEVEKDNPLYNPLLGLNQIGDLVFFRWIHERKL